MLLTRNHAGFLPDAQTGALATAMSRLSGEAEFLRLAQPAAYGQRSGPGVDPACGYLGGRADRTCGVRFFAVVPAAQAASGCAGLDWGRHPVGRPGSLRLMG